MKQFLLNLYSGLNPVIIVAFLVPFINSNLFSQQKIKELNWDIETVYNDSGFTEGPVIAPDGRIFFSDMEKSVIFTYNPLNGKTDIWQKDSRTSNGLYISDNFLYACEATGRAVVRYNLDKGPESREVLMDNYKGKKLGSPNDITIIDNTIYFTEFFLGNRLRPLKAEREIFENRVYLLSMENKNVDSLKHDFKIPNGIAAAPGGNLFYVGDIRSNKITKVEVTNNNVKRISPFIDLSFFEKAGPDGMTVSKNGTLFIALFGGGKIVVIDKNASPIGYLNTGTKTTNCTITKQEDKLYVTTDGRLKVVSVPKGFFN